MKLLKPIKFTFAALLLAITSQANANISPFNIEVDKPTFVIPPFMEIYMERETSVAPDEIEMAENMHDLLKVEDTEAVLKQLDSFYEIELSPALLLLKAQIYFSKQAYDKAEATYMLLLARMPQLVRVHSDLGQLYLIKGKPKKAREHFVKAVTYGAQDSLIYGQLAYLNLTQYGSYSAVAAYQQALALDPEEKQWQQGLFTALTSSGQLQAAQALLNELKAKQPDNKDLWLNQAILSLKQDDSIGALQGLEMAILLGDEREDNIKTAIQLHFQQESFVRAAELIEKHMDMRALDIKTVNRYLAWLRQAQMWKESESILAKLESQMTTFTPQERSRLYASRAHIQLNNRLFSSAKQWFEKSIEEDPTHSRALIDYAELSLQQKDYIKAETLYTRAQADDKFRKQAMLGKAQLYINIQDYQAALGLMQSAMDMYPGMSELERQIEIVKSIIRNNTDV